MMQVLDTLLNDEQTLTWFFVGCGVTLICGLIAVGVATARDEWELEGDEMLCAMLLCATVAAVWPLLLALAILFGLLWVPIWIGQVIGRVTH